MHLERPGLKFKILALILIFISISALILIYSTYNKLREDILQKNAEVFQTFVDTFHSEQTMVIKKYSMALDILMENKSIVAAFKNRDRESLKNLVTELYNTRLKHFYSIEQFQFHTPQAKSFYRAHAPEQYDDDLSAFRMTVLAASRDKNTVAGLEVGRGGLGLRVVKPVWFNYDFLGTVELGGNIENLLSTPYNSTGVEYAAGVFVKSLQRSKYLFEETNRYSYNGMYIYNYSSNTIKGLITSGKMPEERKLISMNGSYYMVKNVPLKDFSSNHIGYLLLCRDTTAEVMAMQKELMKQVMIIFSYAVTTIALLTFAMVRLIFDPLEKITDHISSVKMEDSMPADPIVLKGSSEITMLADAYNILSGRLAESFEKINNQMNEIQVINTSLEKRVQERTKQLEDTNTRLKNAMAEIHMANEAKSEFLASMSHEIRTPMNAVLGLSYLLMQTELSGCQYDYISKIRSSANMLLEIINDVLDFSKIEAGKLELEKTAFSLKEYISRLSGMLEVSLSKKDVSVITEIDENIPDFLFGDPLRFTQVLNNLGTNAAKFTETGSITISARLMTKNETYAKIKIDVQDTGIGIPADKIPILFDSFTQVKRKNQKKHGGSGLGLSISKKILDAMDSDIFVESREGIGSTFTFTVTMQIASESDLDYSELPEQKFSGKRILTCEHSPDRINSVTSFFRENTADVLAVSSQPDLLRQIANNTNSKGSLYFDLIVLDMSLITPEKFIAELTHSVGKPEGIPPIIMLADGTEKTSQTAEKMPGSTLYTIQVSDMLVKLPEIAADILTFGSRSAPDTSGLRQNTAALNGLHVLIADDNDLNLQVITEFAEILNLSYQTAKNGKEALEALENNRFDMVFMDLIMPEMDGITAAEQIRRNPVYGNVPIYALSASTMPEDIEKCRRAGMNGHIAKPVKLQDITMAIRDCTDADIGAGRVQWENAEIPPKSSELDTELALSYLNGNRKLYSELLSKFHREYKDQTKASEEILSLHDPDRERKYFHTIKGVARTIGAIRLSEAAEELEKDSVSGLDIKESEWYRAFTDAADKLDAELDQFYNNQG